MGGAYKEQNAGFWLDRDDVEKITQRRRGGKDGTESKESGKPSSSTMGAWRHQMEREAIRETCTADTGASRNGKVGSRRTSERR